MTAISREVIEVPGREVIICTVCPLGCRVEISLDRRGAVSALKGAECAQGEKYVVREFKSPVRTVTATVRTGEKSFPLIPVRTSRPVPRELIGEVMRETARARAKAPVKAGDVIVKNILKTGVDLIATTDWPARQGAR